LGKWLEQAKQNDEQEQASLPDAAEIIQQIYKETFQGAALLPVLETYQEILGTACWVCSTAAAAERKNRSEYLTLTVTEFMEIVKASYNRDELRRLVTAKQTFNGTIQTAS
jgi:CHASE2 domain-containing sensor protein